MIFSLLSSNTVTFLSLIVFSFDIVEVLSIISSSVVAVHVSDAVLFCVTVDSFYIFRRFIKVSTYLCLFRVGLPPFGSICILIKAHSYKSFINTITQNSQLTTQYKHKQCFHCKFLQCLKMPDICVLISLDFLDKGIKFL